MKIPGHHTKNQHSHQETMNPGTVLFIVLGIIGLLIYISKAIKPDTKEHFAVVDEAQISNKGKEGLESLKSGALNFESLLSAFSTPDVNMERSMNAGSVPSVSDFAKFKKNGADSESMLPPSMAPPPLPPMPTQAPAPMQTQAPIQTQAPVPMQTQAQVIPLVNAQTLPVLTPSSIINMPNAPQNAIPNLSPSITISDLQGATLPKPTEAFKEQNSRRRRRRSRSRRREKIVYLPKSCPPMPDMSQYIRKDSIPCWGCNLK